MIHNNPYGDLPNIHKSAYVNQASIACSKLNIEENGFVDICYELVQRCKRLQNEFWQ